MMELDKNITIEVSQTRKTNKMCIHLYEDISCSVNVNQTTICRATDVRYKVRSYRVQIDLVNTKKQNR